MDAIAGNSALPESDLLSCQTLIRFVEQIVIFLGNLILIQKHLFAKSARSFDKFAILSILLPQLDTLPHPEALQLRGRDIFAIAAVLGALAPVFVGLNERFLLFNSLGLNSDARAHRQRADKLIDVERIEVVQLCENLFLGWRVERLLTDCFAEIAVAPIIALAAVRLVTLV